MFKRLSALFLSLAFAICFSAGGCGKHAEGPVSRSTRPSRTAATVPSGTTAASSSAATGGRESGPLFWEVNTKDGDGRLYVLGSIHVADDSSYPLRKPITDAFSSSDALAVEADIVTFESDLSAQIKCIKEIMYLDGTTIADHVPKEIYDGAVALLKKHNLYMQQYDYYKPVLWTSMMDNIIVGMTGLDPNKGIDRYFLDRAKKEGKEILEVESAFFQYQMLGAFSDGLQSYMLQSYVEDTKLEEQAEELKALYADWKAGKPVGEYSKPDADLSEEETAWQLEYNQAMLIDRNRGMANKALEYLRSGQTVFFVVGAAHMTGDDGVVALLREKGCRVTQI